MEGQDGQLLRRMAARLNFSRLADVQGIPIVQLGGFSQWRRAVDAVWAFRQLLDLQIEAFCLFDRDYRCDGQINHFLSTVGSTTIGCRVHVRKEIENYLLIPEGIQKAISNRLQTRASERKEFTMEDTAEPLQSATEPFRSQVMSRTISSFLQFAEDTGSKLDRSTVIENAGSTFEKEWSQLESRLAIVPGKDVLAKLNDILRERLKISLTETMIVAHITKLNCPIDMLQTLEMLEGFCSD